VTEVVALRAATPEDTPFLARVYGSTRAAELACLPFSEAERTAFLAQQFAAQGAHYARVFGDAEVDVVLVDGAAAGRLIVARRGRTIHIVDIALLPAFRGRGIGTRLLAPILAEADAAGATVTLHADRAGAARRLYARLGFVVVEEDALHVTLNRSPRGADA
jgi:ribosomal protein S18 acetylase RimI-like enzyme